MELETVEQNRMPSPPCPGAPSAADGEVRPETASAADGARASTLPEPERDRAPHTPEALDVALRSASRIPAKPAVPDARSASPTLNAICAPGFGAIPEFEMPATADPDFEGLVDEVAAAFAVTPLAAKAVLIASASALVAGGVTITYERTRAVPVHLVLVDGGHGIAPLVAELRDVAGRAREEAHRREICAFREEDARHRAMLETLSPGDPYPGGPPERPQPPPPAILVSPEKPAIQQALERLGENGAILGYTPRGAPAIAAGLGSGRPPAVLATIEAAECRAIAARVSSIGHATRDAVLRWASGMTPQDARRAGEDWPPAGTILVEGGPGRGVSAAVLPRRLRDAVTALAQLNGPVRLRVEDVQKVREEVEITVKAVGKRSGQLTAAVAPCAPASAFVGLVEMLEDRIWSVSAALHLWKIALAGDLANEAVSSKTVEQAAILSRALAAHEWEVLRPAALPRQLRDARAVWNALGRLPDPTSLDCVGSELREVPRSAVRLAIDTLVDAGLVERVVRDEEERKRGAVPILVRRARRRT